MQSIETEIISTKPAKPKKSEKAEKKLRQAAADLRKALAAEKEQERKKETRAKILLGGSIFADMKSHPERKKYYEEILRRVVKKPLDLELLREFGFALPAPASLKPTTNGNGHA